MVKTGNDLIDTGVTLKDKNGEAIIGEDGTKLQNLKIETHGQVIIKTFNMDISKPDSKITISRK